MELLQTIISAYKDNRSKISDLMIQGRVDYFRGTGHDEPDDSVDFQYFQLGEKRRIDQSYPQHFAGESWAGRTFIYAFDGKNTLSFIPERLVGGIDKPRRYHLDSEITPLDTHERVAKWRNHVEHIEHLLRRGWKPDKESIKVSTVYEDGKALFKVVYRSTRGGGLTSQDWIFDPARGYEVTRVSKSSTFPDGRPFNKIEASYDIRQVHPGIWRAVAVEHREESWIESGKLPDLAIKIHPASVVTNSGHVDEGAFTFEGIGLTNETMVTDRTVSPHVDYVYGAPPVTDAVLDDIFEASGSAPAEDKHKSEPVQDEREKPTIGIVDPCHGKARQDLTARDSPDAVPLGSVFNQPWFVLVSSSVLVLLLGGVLGYSLRRRWATSTRRVEEPEAKL
jgi:hypothetical protein